MPTARITFCLLITLITTLTPSAQANETNHAGKATVTASSEREGASADFATDGMVADKSRWLATEGDPQPWIELVFGEPQKVGMIDVFSGYKTGDSLKDFNITLELNSTWVQNDSWQIRNNTQTSKRVYIDRDKVSKIRLALTRKGPARIREIAVYDNKEALGLLDVGTSGQVEQAFAIDIRQHQIGLNQIGYLTDRPKRFTAPLSADGIQFTIRNGDQIVYKGKIENGIGDFTDFKPAESDSRYTITLSGGDLKENTSHLFLIRNNLAQEHYWQTATDFLNDVRSVTGSHPSAYGGCAFRDGTYYDAIVPALVQFYLADQAFVEAMPHQIDWQAEKKRVMAPDFPFDANNPGSGGVMEATRNYYQLDLPKADAPDVVKLIHWGAGYILMKPNGRDPSSSKDRAGHIEPQTVEQIAYVLWAWPALKKWLPQSFYDQCRDFCFKNWHGSLRVSRFWNAETYMTTESFDESIHNPGNMHPFKGRHAPGHSIVPNLLMHEIAKQEGRDDAQTYLDAAIQQTEWIIKNLDWNDPRTTKGHRLSEHRTIPNLVWMLQKYPDHAPAGLKAKITQWSEIAVSRSHNLWDFRKYSDDMWSIPGMNEVGNSLGLPAITLAASWVVDDPELKKELERIAISSIDHLFGRNPMLAASTPHPKQGLPEIERGWPKLYKHDVCARLETVRG
ncbi:MAG: discoidin domain-containing protein, partial [Akkermansiaceae bacterium]|nr:discoidin domain-containing protein [Akkermansiaceae bacterium]